MDSVPECKGWAIEALMDEAQAIKALGDHPRVDLVEVAGRGPDPVDRSRSVPVALILRVFSSWAANTSSFGCPVRSA